MISHLDKKPFEEIRNGSKRYELRLLDEKRKHIRVGDKITFISRIDPEETVTVEVTGLLNFKTFAEAYDNLKKKYFSEYEKEEFVSGCYEIYSRDEEQKYTVLVIEIKLQEGKL